MKGDKINASNLDQVVGGSVTGETFSVSLHKGDVMLVRGGKVSTISKIQFEEALDISIYPMSSEQFSAIKEMVYGGQDYSVADVKAKTGIDLDEVISKW